jgi:hypothetical protein
LFLRSGEATGDKENNLNEKIPTRLTSDSFDLSLCSVEGGIIKSLAVKVKGDADKSVQTLMLWPDEGNRNF